MRDQHFYASIDKAQALLGWTPKYGLVDGLKDSYDKDFGRGMFRKAADFEVGGWVWQACTLEIVCQEGCPCAADVPCFATPPGPLWP